MGGGRAVSAAGATAGGSTAGTGSTAHSTAHSTAEQRGGKGAGGGRTYLAARMRRSTTNARDECTLARAICSPWSAAAGPGRARPGPGPAPAAAAAAATLAPAPAPAPPAPAPAPALTWPSSQLQTLPSSTRTPALRSSGIAVLHQLCRGRGRGGEVSSRPAAPAPPAPLAPPAPSPAPTTSATSTSTTSTTATSSSTHLCVRVAPLQRALVALAAAAQRRLLIESTAGITCGIDSKAS